ncbi:sel1 repeat family protein, partial [Chromobacterium sp. Panama]
MSTLSPKQQEALAFRCVHQQLPTPTPEAEQLFLYARHLQKNNLLRRKPDVTRQVQRLYRIAAAHGHVKANINLQNGLTDGDFAGGFREVLALNDKLMDLSPAPGYYNLAYYTSRGYGNIKRDRELALRYFRKAADLGNPEAQFHVAELLNPYDKAPEISRQMYRCAAEQGHGQAGNGLGNDLAVNKRYAEAVEAFQLGVKAGNSTAAGFLEKGFKTPPPDDGMYYMALKLDPERSRRYQQIGKFLYNYSYLQPTVEEVDQIVPLPPAPLPPWDGGFRWLKAFRGPGPAQPSE